MTLPEWEELHSWQSSRCRPWVEGYLINSETYPGAEVAIWEGPIRYAKANPSIREFLPLPEDLS